MLMITLIINTVNKTTFILNAAQDSDMYLYKEANLKENYALFALYARCVVAQIVDESV